VNKWGEVAEKILEMLEDGPMTRAEICLNLGRDKQSIASIVSRLARDTAKAGKRIYVKSYVWDMEGERRYPRAVYALGKKADAPKPAPDVKATKARYWAKRKTKLTCNSVFNLALTRRELDDRKKAWTS
jgi:hypothetical protein